MIGRCLIMALAIVGILLTQSFFAPETALAQEFADPMFEPDAGSQPAVRFEMNSGEDGNFVPAIKIALLLMGLTLLPAILVSVTSFTRIIIVLGFLRQALGIFISLRLVVLPDD